MKSIYKNLEKVCDIRSMLCEGPCWDEIDKKIYWIDIVNKNIHSFDYKSLKSSTLHLDKYIGSMGLTKTGDIVATLQDGFYFVEKISGFIKLAKKVNENKDIKRFNDGKIDSAGNYWAGTVSYDEKKSIGMFYCLKPDLKLKRFFEGILISNGIAWSLDNKKMYYIDTPTMKVDVFDFDIEESEITNRRTAFEIPKDIGYPDGMTIDAEGKLWIAHWGGYQVCRWDPIKKVVIEKIKLPAERVSCCVFGGNDLSELFITTARFGFVEDMRQVSQPESGFLYKIQTSTRGLKTSRFGF